MDDKQTLLPADFDYLEGRATLVVCGELTIASEIDPRLLADRLTKVHNLGQIKCTPAQTGAVRARLGMSEGRLTDSTKVKTKPDDEDEDRIGNAGYLKL